MRKLLIAAACAISLILLTLPIIHYFKTKTNEKEMAIEECVKACREALISGKELSNGPCLLDPIPNLKNWVCDVAHSPRQPIDNLPENQCSSFREKRASHFVEVDLACNFIRAI